MIRAGAWVDTARGMVVQPTGELGWMGAAANHAFAGPLMPRLATAFALAIAALGFPLWATAVGGPGRRALVGLAASAMAVGTFHLVAAGRLSPAVLAIAPALILGDAVMLHRGAKEGHAWR